MESDQLSAVSFQGRMAENREVLMIKRRSFAKTRSITAYGK
jgi:hypothetical protein